MVEAKRIGLLLPSSNTTMEPELYRMAPEGVTIHTARMMLGKVTPEGLEEMAEDAVRAASMLKTAEVDILLYGCTSGSILKGVEWEANLVKGIQDATGTPTISTGRAVVEALRAMNIRRVSVATPYIDEINSLEKRFLEGHGLEVTKISGLGITRNPEIANVSQEEVRELAKAVSGEADGVFISCTNLPTIGIIESLEAELRKPLVTSNQASIWAALRALGSGRVEGFGTLLRRYLPETKSEVRRGFTGSPRKGSGPQLH